jgi:hypothetical protein
MMETAAKREQEHQQQLDQIQGQWSESVKEIHRGHTMLQNATVRRQDELSAQVLALVQAISALTVSVEDMQQDALLPLLREMMETAAKREQDHQQQLDQIQEQWSESVMEIHRGHTMLQNATVRRQD